MTYNQVDLPHNNNTHVCSWVPSSPFHWGCSGRGYRRRAEIGDWHKTPHDLDTFFCILLIYKPLSLKMLQIAVGKYHYCPLSTHFTCCMFINYGPSLANAQNASHSPPCIRGKRLALGRLLIVSGMSNNARTKEVQIWEMNLDVTSSSELSVFDSDF